MAENEAVGVEVATGDKTPGQPAPTKTRSEKMALLRKQYAVPVPIRTFPLPSFYPSNPLSLVQLAYTWLSQAFWPPPPEPFIIHVGVWSPATRSVNITDPRSMRTLWEQGFFGKGNYSRSEPSWMRRKEARKGTLEGDGYVAENATLKRRADREQTKWERSRAQIEALEQILQEEGDTGKRQLNPPSTPESKTKPNGRPNGLPNGHAHGRVRDALPPVGPLQLLALPNSAAELVNGITVKDSSSPLQVLRPKEMNASADPLIPLTPPNDTALPGPVLEPGITEAVNGSAPGSGSHDKHSNGSASRDQQISAVPMKRRKSVRFSPKVESTTFIHSDPPSPYHSAVNLSKISGLCVSNETPTSTNGSILVGSAQRTPTTKVEEIQTDVGNKEHLQLSAEEAFFLTFAIGALKILRPDSGEPFTTQELFELLRRHSYFPPRISPSPDLLSPDDPFLVQYAVYHHFRSLGWVVRGGIKFGVDWLIYNGGPVFDHAAFGLVVIPEYSDPWWKAHSEAVPQREPWSWLHCHSRVLARVYKHLVLVYVDVPPPDAISSEQGIVSILKRYHIREIMVGRWSPNRNR